MFNASTAECTKFIAVSWARTASERYPYWITKVCLIDIKTNEQLKTIASLAPGMASSVNILQTACMGGNFDIPKKTFVCSSVHATLFFLRIQHEICVCSALLALNFDNACQNWIVGCVTESRSLSPFKQINTLIYQTLSSFLGQIP